jgi:uncharacterized phage protein (TIGR01671 family)
MIITATADWRVRMREIKFRGKRKDNGQWVYGYLYENEFESCIIKDEMVRLKTSDVNGPEEYDTAQIFIQVDPKTTGQLTGRKDRNEDDIFEGDIIKDDIGRICIIEWLEKEACFIYRDLKDDHKYSLTGHIYDSVIGNIHENPELLKYKPSEQ